MKILSFTELLHPDSVGGAGRVAAELAKHLAGQGTDVRVITRVTSSSIPEEERDGYEIFRYPVHLGNSLSLWFTTKSGVDKSIARALVDWTPDILDLHQPLIGYHALNNQRLKNIPVVYNYHSSWGDELRIRGGLHRYMSPIGFIVEKMVYKKCDIMVPLSDFSASSIKRFLSSPHFIKNPGGVDLDAFPLKKQSPNTNVIFTVRNLVRRMGLDMLIDAAYILKNKGIEFQLRIGGDGPLKEELKTRAVGLGTSCIISGRLSEEELTRNYHEADLFILPTKAIEGFGLVILESFASGTPVIGTPVGAIPELLRLQGEGYVTATVTPESLASSLEWFLRLKEKPTPSRLRKIAEDYTWKKRAERMLMIYNKITRRDKWLTP